jgi:hypothetical protein
MANTTVFGWSESDILRVHGGKKKYIKPTSDLRASNGSPRYETKRERMMAAI